MNSYKPTKMSQKNAVIVNRPAFNGTDEVEVIDCTNLVETIGGTDVIEWNLYLNTMVSLSFQGVITELSSTYGKTTLSTSVFPPILASVFRDYLAKPRDEREYTVPVWINRDGTMLVRVNTKRLVQVLASGKNFADSRVAVSESEGELLQAFKDKRNVVIDAYLVPYCMNTGESTKMGLYFDVIKAQIL